jgi:hypothetical protein
VTDPNYRHYILIVDRSGSMDIIKDDAQGGIRQFVKEQDKLPGKATISLYQFDTEHDHVHSFAPLSDAAQYELVPRGGTALLDACGFAVQHEGEKLNQLPEDERPGKVIVLITTDGRENSSREYSKAEVKKLITRQQDKYGWAFSYIGANQDSFTEAGAIGIPQMSTMDYASSSVGTQSAYGSASAAASRYVRGLSGQSFSYTLEEREDAKKED